MNTSKRTIYTRTGACGAGKTFTTLNDIIDKPGQYLWAVEKVDLLLELQTQVTLMAEAAGRDIEVVIIASHSHESGNTRNCRNAIEALPRTFDAGHHDHVIVFVTHTSLLNSDLSGHPGWHLVIDEVPSIMVQSSLSSRAAWSWFDTHFSLSPAKLSGWSTVELKSRLTRTELGGDSSLAGLLTFYDRVTNEASTVLANVTDWSTLAEPDVEWSWWSVWDIGQLGAFRTVTVLGNDFLNSFFAKLVEGRGDTEFVELPLLNGREFARRSMEINFFARKHVASSSHFASPAGKRHLEILFDHLCNTVIPARHIWMTHSSIGLGLTGKRLTPRQAGSNLWSDRTEATMIFTAKPSPVEMTILGALGVDPDVIRQERELATILQFACRTAVRDPVSHETLTLTVYDQHQAEYLARYFHGLQYVDVSLRCIDLGFADYERLERRPERAEITPEAATARRDAKRAADRARLAQRRAAKRDGAPARAVGRPRNVEASMPRH